VKHLTPPPGPVPPGRPDIAKLCDSLERQLHEVRLWAAELRTRLDDLLAAHRACMSDLWSSVGELNRRVAVLEGTDRPEAPTDGRIRDLFPQQGPYSDRR
jgi:hypothetical protein